MLRLINRPLGRLGIMVVPSPPSARMLRRFAVVGTGHPVTTTLLDTFGHGLPPHQAHDTVRWLRRVADLMDGGTS